nr:probable glutathione S-transferase [Ipomoea batatas]
MEEVVKLHGISYNLFTYRVIWGLKLKGIPFEYIEEEHSDKSPFILQHNPVFKSFPVLFHRPPPSKPICDSMVILEYIDQTWPHNPLLPTHPYRRAVARFWAKFAHDRGQCIGRMYYSTGEEQAKAIEETLEMLRIVEEGAVGEERFMCGGETVGMVDLAFAVIPQWLEVIEDVVGVKLLDPNSFPRLHKWIQNFKQHPLIKQHLPDRNAMFHFLKAHREMLLASPP